MRGAKIPFGVASTSPTSPPPADLKPPYREHPGELRDYGHGKAVTSVPKRLDSWIRSTGSSQPAQGTSAGNAAFAYPSTRSEPKTYERHGLVIQDEYLWLEEPQAPEVKAWVQAQNVRSARHLGSIRGREWIQAELDEVSTWPWSLPKVRHGDFEFRQLKGEGLVKPHLVWSKPGEEREHVLLDPNRWEHGPDAVLSAWRLSPDGTRLAYLVSDNNADSGTLHFLDVSSGTRWAEAMPGVFHGMAWDEEGLGVFYSSRDDDGARKYHRLGEDPSRDPTLFSGLNDLDVVGRYHIWSRFSPGELEPKLWIGGRAWGAPLKPLPMDPEWSRICYSEGPDGQPWMLVRNTSGVGRIVQVDPEDPHPSQWREVLRLDDASDLVSFVVQDNRLVLHRFWDGLSRVTVSDLDGSNASEVALPSLGRVAMPWDGSMPWHNSMGLSRTPGGQVFLSFTSPVHPVTHYALSVTTGQLREVARQSTGTMDPSRYTTERVEYRSRDGTLVPLTLVYRKGLVRDGLNPTLLYGYGAYGFPSNTEFDALTRSWLDRSGVYAIPGVRGGGDRGPAWHEDGRHEHKQNSIDDFIAAAEHLVSSGVTCPEKLAARGGSAGGLLVGAAIVQRPDLFRAAAVDVGPMDLARDDLWVSPSFAWISEEYGDINQPSDFKTMLAYSPYHNLQADTSYPAVLFTCGSDDERVPPMHAWKMAARMQQSLSKGPVYVRTLENTPHNGPVSLSTKMEHLADQYAFLFQQLGVPLSKSREGGSPRGWEVTPTE